MSNSLAKFDVTVMNRVVCDELHFFHIRLAVLYVNQYLRNAKQLYLEDERGASGDAWLRKLAVTHFSRYIDLPFVAHTHLLYGDNPTLDEVTKTDCQRSTVTAAVKLLAVDGTSCVMGSDYASGRGMFSVCFALCQYLIVYTFGERFYTLFLCFICKPNFISLRVFSFVHVFYGCRYPLISISLAVVRRELSMHIRSASCR